jgi:putative transposase
MRRIEPYFPLWNGMPRVDDRRVVSGIVYVIWNGLMWCDAPRGYGPHRRSTTASSAGAGWACSPHLRRTGGQGGRAGYDHDRCDPPDPKGGVVKAHRTAASLLKGGLFPYASLGTALLGEGVDVR